VKVNADLSVPGHPEVFVIGDTALVVAPVRHLFGVKSRQPEPLPGLAPPAIQGGEYVARLISRRLRGQPPPGPFRYLDKGSLAIVGRDFAIADFKVFRLWGWPAWWLWLGAHIFFLIGFANRLLVITQWGISFLTNRRGVRIFPPESEEAVAREMEGKPTTDGRETTAVAPLAQGASEESGAGTRQGTGANPFRD
jgi:NADH dehydrogenase